jgi:hypothetical protein
MDLYYWENCVFNCIWWRKSWYTYADYLLKNYLALPCVWWHWAFLVYSYLYQPDPITFSHLEFHQLQCWVSNFQTFSYQNKACFLNSSTLQPCSSNQCLLVWLSTFSPEDFVLELNTFCLSNLPDHIYWLTTILIFFSLFTGLLYNHGSVCAWPQTILLNSAYMCIISMTFVHDGGSPQI